MVLSSGVGSRLTSFVANNRPKTRSPVTQLATTRPRLPLALRLHRVASTQPPMGETSMTNQELEAAATLSLEANRALEANRSLEEKSLVRCQRGASFIE